MLGIYNKTDSEYFDNRISVDIGRNRERKYVDLEKRIESTIAIEKENRVKT